MSRQAQKASTYVPQIDGLRAVAVMAVMTYHLSPSLLPGGFSGVDVFFVISGYVISAALARAAREPLGRFLLGFYARRVLRIMPPLMACLLVTSVAATMLIPNSWLSSTSQDTGLYAFFGLSNFALVWLSDGYFSPRVEFNPYAHTWSLGVEEQFYAIFPLLFFIWARLSRRKGVLRLAVNSLLGGLLLLSLIWSWHSTAVSPDRAYYLLPSRFWELACGGLLFQLQSRGKVVLNSVGSADGVMWLGLAMVLLGFFLARDSSFPFPWALPTVGGAALLLAGLSSPSAPSSYVAKALGSPPLVLVGQLSYSLYLWHWPVNVLFRWTVGFDTLPYKALAVTLTTALAVSSFYLLESRVRRNGLALARLAPGVVAAGIVCTLLCYTLAGGVFAQRPRISLSVTRDERTWYPYPSPGRPASTQEGCQTIASFARVGGVGVSTFQRVACKRDEPPRRLFVVGDSHAGAYASMLYRLAEEEGVRVHVYSEAGCGAASLLKTYASLGARCSTFLQTSVADIQKRAAPGDVIFLAALRMNRLCDQWSSFEESEVVAGQNIERSRAERRDALDEADRLLDTLSAMGLHVIIDAPQPVFKAPAFRCSDWFNRGNSICAGGLTISREFLLNLRRPVMDSLESLSIKHPDLVAWDALPVLCPGELCAAADQRGQLFFDGDHLSGNGNRVIYPSFLSLLKGVWATDAPGRLEREDWNLTTTRTRPPTEVPHR
jgi:peptidoglycan/LPS O-acetylase OafA/YrhL